MTAPRPGPAGVPSSGSALADALEHLPSLAERPVHEHVEVFDAVHRLLQAELAGLDGV